MSIRLIVFYSDSVWQRKQTCWNRFTVESNHLKHYSPKLTHRSSSWIAEFMMIPPRSFFKKLAEQCTKKNIWKSEYCTPNILNIFQLKLSDNRLSEIDKVFRLGLNNYFNLKARPGLFQNLNKTRYIELKIKIVLLS